MSGYLDALPVCNNEYFFYWMLINWVQEGPPVTKAHSCGLFHISMPVTHGCWVCPWREMKKAKGCEASTSKGERRAESKGKFNFSSSKPSPASQSDDVVLSIILSMAWNLPGSWLALLKLTSVHVNVLASPPAGRQRCEPLTHGSSQRIHFMVRLSGQPEKNSILYSGLWAELLARLPHLFNCGSEWRACGFCPIASHLICWYQRCTTAITQSPRSYPDFQAFSSLSSNHSPPFYYAIN